MSESRVKTFVCDALLWLPFNSRLQSAAARVVRTIWPGFASR